MSLEAVHLDPRFWPAWRYAASGPPKLITGPHQEAEGWYDSPAKVPQMASGEPTAPPEPTILPAPMDTVPGSPTPASTRKSPVTTHKNRFVKGGA